MSRLVKDNIKTLRKAKGLSQEELAIKVNVVRQTISKWEQGLSVPDAEMLLTLSEVLETPVSVLLGEAITEPKADDLKVISEKLEVINLQLAQRSNKRRTALRWVFTSVCILIVVIFLVLARLDSPYLHWDYSDPEYAVVGVIFHGFEWFFVRVAPFLFGASLIGVFLIRRKS